MQKQAAREIPRRKFVIMLSCIAVTFAFFAPLVRMSLPPTVWYPYNHSPVADASVTYRYLGAGAVFWSPNHYWVYVGPAVLQISNSSASTITVRSADQNGVAIFGYYVVFSDTTGRVLKTGYTDSTFSAVAGHTYSIQVEDYGTCKFSRWSDGKSTTELSVVAGSGERSFTAIYNC